MINLAETTHSKMARVNFLRRLVAMLVDSGTVRPDISQDELFAVCAIILVADS